MVIILKILKDAFEALDADKSGFIDKKEFSDIMKGSGFKDNEIDELMNQIDTDNDGKINLKEFCESFKI